jgi:hypothetical protein
MSACPACGQEIVRPESKVCPHCWARLGSPAPAPRSSGWQLLLFSLLVIGTLTYLGC